MVKYLSQLGCAGANTVRDRKVYMSADGRITSGRDYYSISKTEDTAKIIKTQNGILIGCVGHVKNKQTILEHYEWFDFDPKTNFNKNYLVNMFISKLYRDERNRRS